MGAKNNSFFKMAVILTLIVVTIIAALVLINSKSETKANVSLEKQPPIEGQPVLGDADAPVTVVEFGDYKCPACKSWGDEFLPHLFEEYVNKGKVKFSYINVLFHGEESELGSLAGEAIYKQNPDSYWEFHKKLFSQQPSPDHDSKWITPETINEVAGTISGIDLTQLQKDMQNPSVMAELEKDTKLVEEFKVEKTPTIMVNDTVLENPFDYELIISLIEKELEER
ncbi:DsbA family protein [Mesobacillus maritimus]|uniref:DsbA family protein n=1 Tax=Mesobacillus maritimus TaxID=1643336 RepID=UPI00203E621B|nr:DsbA family protein [Mesobacillus maritimus]MCM3668973.1 DsbA family protein [Mesobacillus maritimus]